MRPRSPSQPREDAGKDLDAGAPRSSPPGFGAFRTGGRGPVWRIGATLTGAGAYAALAMLTLLGFAALPIFPATKTASVRLQSVQAPLAGPLPGENPYEVPNNLAGSASRGAGTDGTPGAGVLMLSVPRLGLKDVRVPTSSSQVDLDRAGIIRLESSGAPSEPGSNTFIVGHAIGYPGGSTRTSSTSWTGCGPETRSLSGIRAARGTPTGCTTACSCGPRTTG